MKYAKNAFNKALENDIITYCMIEGVLPKWYSRQGS
jgi:hypothetical protein